MSFCFQNPRVSRRMTDAPQGGRGWAVVIVLLSLLTAGAATDFRSMGPNLLAGSPAAERWTARGGEIRPASGGFELAASSATQAVSTATVTLEAGAEYFFAARVQSADRVVFVLEETKMAYHTQGREQTVCGLIRSAQGGSRDLQILLSPLEGRTSASAHLQDLVLKKVERPQTVQSRPRNGRTALAKNGKPSAVIVYPAGSAFYQGLAEQVKDAVREASGVVLPVATDAEVTEKKHPLLTAEYAGQNLIVLGRLGNNRALWPAYNRFLTAEDGYYPGGDGYVIRTAVDVLGQGGNHLILGGSSDQGAARAVKAFCALVGQVQERSGESVSLPWLLQVELGGACRTAFAANEQLWRNPDDDRLPAMTSGYGKIARWYQNAMGYYWSGETGYLDRSQTYLKQLLSERAYTHQYLVEFFIRGFDMLDDSPALTSEEVAQLDGLVLENFLDFSSVESSWMAVFSPPYDEITLVNRHQIAPWYADLVMAQFLERHVELSGALKELVAFRASEKQTAFRAFVSGRNGPSMPGMATAASDWEEIPATFFRFALENGYYEEFFDSGLADQALALERFDHISGRYVSPGAMSDLLPVWLGAMTQLTGKTHYEWLRRNLPFVRDERGSFQGRYVAGVHRYQPDEALVPERPGSDALGIQISPQPHRNDQTEAVTTSQFPFLSFRDGFAATDDFLAVIGHNTAVPSGTLLTARIGGVPFVQSGGPAEAGRALSNGASAVRLSGYKVGRAPRDESASPSEVRWTALLPRIGAFEVQTELSPEMRWTRIVARLDKGVFVFCDTFKALQPGQYLLRVGWWPGAPLRAVKDGWQMVSDQGSVGITVEGEGFSAALRSDSLNVEATRTMKTGEQATVWTLVQKEDGRSPWTVRGQGPEQIAVTGEGREELVVRSGPLTTKSGTLSAGLIVASPSSIDVFGFAAEAGQGLKSFALPRAGNAGLAWSEGSTISLAEIDQALSATPVSPLVADPAAEMVLSDETASWTEAWTYAGLQKPSALSDWKVEDGLVDFGRVVDLAEIRSLYRGRTYEVTSVPREIEVAPVSAATPPGPSSKDWIRTDGRFALRPQPRTGNYGETLPMKDGDESLFLSGVKTRFLKAPGASGLIYYSNDTLAARHPVKLDLLPSVAGVDGPVLKASSDLFPAFPRRDREDDFSLALLEPKTGRALGQIDVLGPVQGALVADQRGTGEAEIFVLKADARIETYSLQGQPHEPIDLFGQFSGFQKTFGRDNTRIPAGGHYMPFSFGLWRPAKSGPSKFVIGRYGSLAFLDGNRKMEGVLNFPSYAAASMLPQGFDFNGDGEDEMLILEMTRLVHVGGKPEAVVSGDGEQFWPQAYHLDAVTYAKDSDTTFLSGPPVHIFEVLEKFSGPNRLVLVARENYIGLYDAVSHEWRFSWRPPASISGAALTRQDAGALGVMLATRDGLLWTLNWSGDRLNRPTVDLKPAALEVREIRAGGDNNGEALIAAREGLFRVGGSEPGLVRLAQGDFQSALSLGPGRVAAADITGKVKGFQKAGLPSTALRQPDAPRP